MLDKSKPQLRINLNRKLSYELNYGIQNNILSLSVPIENSDKDNLLQFSNKNK